MKKVAYLRKEKETVEVDYSLEKIWVAIPKTIASLGWIIEEIDDKLNQIKVKTKGSFLSYPSVFRIKAIAINKKTMQLTVIAETPVTTITSIADFGRTRHRIDLFFQALANQLTVN